MGPVKLKSLFDPQSIAVFGASTGGISVGAHVFENLTKGGFEGKVYPVNPAHGKIGGKTCYPSISEVPGRVDLAVIATPAATVSEIIRQCGEAGTRHAIVLSAGFRDVGGAGIELENALIEVARQSGVRVLGPNCVGLVRPALRMNASFLNIPPPGGNLALVSQSGALCSAISDWAGPNHLGFSAVVSLGNSADIGFGDTLDFLASDPETDAILLYVEGVRHPRSFVSALRAATWRKPVIVLKAGRHGQSSQAATTHTGALMGSDEVFDAALERGGAVRAETFGELFAAAEILSANRRSKGNRLGIVTNGGGAGVLAADRAGDLRLDLAEPSGETVATLDKVLSPYWSHANPIDILGDAGAAQYKTAVRAALDDPNFDGLVVMLTPQAMTDATAAAQAVLDGGAGTSRKPVLACWMGESSVTDGRRLLSQNGIPDFTTPERAIEAFSYLARRHERRLMSLETPDPRPEASPYDVEGADLIIEGALMDGRSVLSDTESKAVLRAFGIPINPTIEAATASKALVAAETLGFPVAIKISSPEITHKSDVGSVRLGIATAADVKLAFDQITANAHAARPDATIAGVTVEPMVNPAGARELLVGVSRDPVFGPSILFGAGGTMAEMLRDYAVTLPPLNALLARRLIERTRVSGLMSDFRDQPAVDRDGVVDILIRIGDLIAACPAIIEMDINPLLAMQSGVLAVDARISVRRPSGSMRPGDHLAIAPYPEHLVEHGHLSDGTALTIRPIRADDARDESDFVRRLSPRSRRLRFMGAMKELTPEMLARFTQIDYGREMALVAVIGEGDQRRQVGVARYYLNGDGTSCEFALVVSDEVQGRGIGTRLMKALLDVAEASGLETMEGEVLAENEPMLQLVAELGFQISPHAEAEDIRKVTYSLR
jgi:acetyltransferase